MTQDRSMTSASGTGGMGFKSGTDQISTHCQRLATAATLKVWALAQRRRVGHRSLVTPVRVLSEYNKD